MASFFASLGFFSFTTLKTLVAPILFEPSFLISVLAKNLARISPKGIVYFNLSLIGVYK